MTLILAITALLLYSTALAMRWRQRNHSQPSPGALWVTLAALAIHALTCYFLLMTAQGIDLSLVTVSNIVAVALVAVIATANVRLPVGNLYIFLFPISILALCAAVLAPPGGRTFEQLTGALVGHVLISLSAYSALMMAAAQSIMLAVQERHVRSPSKPRLALLPPLETMERLLVAMLWIGLVLLSASILSGYLFLDNIFDNQALHHIVLTSLSWAVYVFFLTGRYFFGWRGLTAVRWTLVAFSLLVLGYLGSKFVTEYILIS